MAHGGEALGRDGGRVIFVAGALPGEMVRARVTDEKKRWARARLLQVLEPSPQRVEPACPYFGICGGCHWQHMRYEAQLEYKKQVVTDQLGRLGHIADPPVRPTLGMARPWAYRNNVQLAVDGSGRLGFRAARSHEVVHVAGCLLFHPLLAELHGALDVRWPALRRLTLRAGVRTGERLVILETDDPGLAPVDLPASCVVKKRDGREVIVSGQGVYHEVLGGRRFRVSAGSFFQVNTEQAERLASLVADYLEPHADDVLLDLYCGVGTFGLLVRGEVSRVIAVEGHPAAAADARANAGDDDRYILLEGCAEEVLSGVKGVTKAVLDPPRRGCGRQVLAALLRLSPRRIVYVSCDPATMARDAALLVAGGYELACVQPLDMFPQTFHVETVSLWRRR